ncbi:MAG TPA: PQQ-binding-like beta-propeller repeat protein [Verrucomicrobiae bacterium]|nr:PQQ-binding-like beta-propeller repeat protein [Verrucomicrobiae bacterium]
MKSSLRKWLFLSALLLRSATTNGAPGELKWTFPTTNGIRSSPALGTNGLLYFGSLDGNVYAVEASSGAERWRYPQGEPIYSSPAIAPNGVVVIASKYSLLALNGDTGGLRWKVGTSEVYSSPTIGTNGVVYFTGFSYSYVFAVDLATGTNRWGAPMGADRAYGSPSIGANGMVYCGGGWLRSGGVRLFAFDGKTGQEKWNFHTVNSIQATPAIGPDGAVYFPSYDKLIYALDGQTGTQKWSHLLGDSVSSSPALGPDNSIYVGSNDGRLYSLNMSDGSERWNYLTGDTIHSSPALGADGTVYFGSYDKKVYALDARTGSLKWSYPTEGLVLSSPVIASDGTIYIGSMDGKLYAIEGSSAPATGPWPSFRSGMRTTPDSPHLLGISVTPSDAAVKIRTIAGKIHHLESKHDLGENEWQQVETFTGSGWDESRRASQPPADQLFYRIRLQP